MININEINIPLSMCYIGKLGNFSGIYQIRTNDGVYIGSSINVPRRLSDHRRMLKYGKNTPLLQSTYNKNNGADFIITIIPIKGTRKDLESIEEYLTVEARKTETVFNIQNGRKLSDKQKQKVSEVHKGKVISEDQKKKLRGRSGNKSARFKWTKEKVFEAANKCNSKTEFHKIFNGAYERAWRGGYLNELFPNNINPWDTIRKNLEKVV